MPTYRIEDLSRIPKRKSKFDYTELGERISSANIDGETSDAYLELFLCLINQIDTLEDRIKELEKLTK